MIARSVQPVMRSSQRVQNSRFGPQNGLLARVLDCEEADHERAGGKARALAVAIRAGLPVPPFFVVIPQPADPPRREIADEQAAPPPNHVAAAPMSRPVHDRLLTELLPSLRHLCPHGELVAVRSSACDEDGPQHSFAGQFDTCLSVPPHEVIDRVRAIWSTGSSDRLQHYRHQRGLSLDARSPAIVVQRMVHARVSGVAFSADPVSGRRAVVVISAVQGLGSALVSGDTDADTWRLACDGTIIDRRIASKHRKHVVDPCAIDGIRVVDTPGRDAAWPSLSDDEVRAVGALARQCAEQFGRPQDIEWAYAGDRLVLLQSRPITALAALPDPDGALAIWDNSNIIESYGGMTTPLTFSFTCEVYEHVYRQFCRLMRVPDRVVRAHDETFRNMLGFIRGRMYYNLLNWYRVLALFPGFRLNRRFMEQMMGTAEPLPDAVTEQAVRARAPSRIGDSIHLARTAAGLAVSHFTLGRRLRAFNRRLDEALAPPHPPLSARRPDELVSHYRALRKRLLLSWDAPLVNDFFAMVFYGLLRKATIAWCGDVAGTLQNDLLGGEGGMVSAQPVRLLQELAQLASTRPRLLAALRSGTVDRIRAEMDAAAEFQSLFDSYLERFGERTVGELKLESATFHDDPLPLLRSIAALAARLAAQDPRPTVRSSTGSGATLREVERSFAGHASLEDQRGSAWKQVNAALRWQPVRALVFRWLLRHARARVRDRENLRLQRTRLFGRVRRIFVEIGRRFHADHLLNDPNDVFYLQAEEILAFVEGRALTTDLKSLVALRRAELLACASQPPPDNRFETRGVVHHAHSFRQDPVSATTAGEQRHGLGCSPGRVRGQVRIVSDPRGVDLTARAILVAHHTDPGWIVAFPAALGLLIERGSVLSHAAIVARELGIPAIVRVQGVTQWLRDGDWVELDGATGVVRRVVGE